MPEANLPIELRASLQLINTDALKVKLEDGTALIVNAALKRSTEDKMQ